MAPIWCTRPRPTPVAAATTAAYSDRVTGSSSPTLVTPGGSDNAATTARAASSAWIDDW
jgi:hypothetical protein